MQSPIRIITRGSSLALIQATYVGSSLREAADATQKPDLVISTTRTIGDVHRNDWDSIQSSLPKEQRSRKWTDAIESAVVQGRADIAVHSAKDLTWQVLPDTEFIPVLKREDPRDVFISHNGLTLEEMPVGLKVGTNSFRRRAMVRLLRPDARFVDYSGNVNTRIRPERMKEAGVDGLLMASAGLKRCNILPPTAQFLSTNVFLPAINQGILAVQLGRGAPPDLRQLVAQLVDPETELAFVAERAVRTVLQADCESTLAAYAWTFDETDETGLTRRRLSLRARAMSPDGTVSIEASEQANNGETAQELGERVGKMLAARGARELWAQPA